MNMIDDFRAALVRASDRYSVRMPLTDDYLEGYREFYVALRSDAHTFDLESTIQEAAESLTEVIEYMDKHRGGVASIRPAECWSEIDHNRIGVVLFRCLIEVKLVNSSADIATVTVNPLKVKEVNAQRLCTYQNI